MVTTSPSAEADLLLPEGVSVEAVAGAVASRLPVDQADGDGPPRERRFFDTFDALVRAAGRAVVWESGQLALLERSTGRELAVEPIPTAPTRLLAEDLPQGALRDALAKIIDVRALLPQAAVASRSETLAVLDERAKTVARVILEQPSFVVAQSRRLVPLRGRARVRPVRGYEEQAEHARLVLSNELGLEPAPEPLADEAVRAGGSDPAGVSSKVEVALSRHQRSDAAAVAVLQRLSEIVAANLPGTLADLDSEFLHDFRVSLRRARSVQRELRGVFPPEPLAFWRAEFKWLQAITGDARDMDVYVLDFEEFREMVPAAFRSDLEPLRGVLRSRRLAAHRAMARELRSPRASAAFAGWPEFLRGLEALPEDGRPDAARPIAELAGERIAKVYRRMLKMGGEIDDSTPAEAYHELRKKGKELRYLLELFGAPLFDRDVVAPMIKTLKALQDVLGRHQDREVQVATLRSLTSEVAALPGGAEALMAMGMLVERLGKDERAARADFAQRFAAFSAREQRHLVRDTFLTA